MIKTTEIRVTGITWKVFYDPSIRIWTAYGTDETTLYAPSRDLIFVYIGMHNTESE